MKIDTRVNSEEVTNSILQQLGISTNFKADNDDKFYSLEAKKLVRSLKFIETASDFYKKLFNPLNAEFTQSTLICSVEKSTITIKCKYKSCHHRLTF